MITYRIYPDYKTAIISLLLLVIVAPLFANKVNKLNEIQVVNALKSHFGERAGKRGKAWFNLMNKSSDLDESLKLARVNDFFNLLYFVEDIKLWGVSNYWATPIEFLGANAGDCEDFAIAKYFTLLELGIPDHKLRITMVKATSLNQYHMVVAYYPTPSAEPLILDNIKSKIKLASKRQDLIPIYSFNGKQLWLNKKKNQGVLAGQSKRLKLWKDLNLRMGLIDMKQPKLKME